MATEFYFNGRTIKQPGAYATITSGQKNAPLNLDYGRVLFIDTGVEGATWGGGSGIDGTLGKDKDSIYTFDNVEDYQNFLKGGLLYKCADALFRPDTRIAAPGISQVLHARAATTIPAFGTFTATGGGANGGTFKVFTKDEGLIGNGEYNEIRAQATLTITNAGATGDDVTIEIGSTTIALYANASSDDITTVINGIAADMRTTGLAKVIGTTSDSITFTATANQGDALNGTPPTVTYTGAMTGTVTNFAGGINGDVLGKGYAYTFSSGIVDTAKWIMKFWVGTYTGLYFDGVEYNEIGRTVTEPKLLITSPEFDNIQTLIDWATESTAFGRYFTLDTNASSKQGTGAVDSTDIGFPNALNFFVGGTETYKLTLIPNILNSVTDEIFSFIITDIYGTAEYNSTVFTDITDWMANDSRYERMVWYGAGSTELDFDSTPGSISIAQYFNKDSYVVVHGSVGTASNRVASGFRYWPSLYHACLALGRTAGKEPQVPVTNKTLGIDVEYHNLTSRQKDRALDAGVLVSHYNNYINRIVVLQGVNSLQDNKQLFNNLGQSFQISFKRIIMQINLELIVNAERSLLSDENGVNANTLSIGIVKNFTETYLQSRLAKPDLDNLILDYRDITVTKQQDACLVTYGLVVNNEVNKIFFTGFLFS